MTTQPNICVSYETAEKLKAAGWVKKTVFVCDHDGTLYLTLENDKLFRMTHEEVFDSEDVPFGIIPAPTFTEIWEELPMNLSYWNGVKKPSYKYHFTHRLWHRKYANGDGTYRDTIIYKALYNKCYNIELPTRETDNATEAAAEMWLLGKKEGWVK
jgi:hypothetical protein